MDLYSTDYLNNARKAVKMAVAKAVEVVEEAQAAADARADAQAKAQAEAAARRAAAEAEEAAQAAIEHARVAGVEAEAMAEEMGAEGRVVEKMAMEELVKFAFNAAERAKAVNKAILAMSEKRGATKYKNGGKKTKKINKNTSKKTVENITNEFIYNVTKSNNSTSLNNQFCNNGYLIATLSRKTRRKTKQGGMKEYFDYFANLKGISVLSKHYDIQKISKNVYLNQATIEWKWDDINKPVTARMTFIIKNNCIFLLHSSSLPPFNKKIN